ncbi:MAG: insulinase family protein [Muribaculaceae bacterium]|nr:insulinase family protein [Muribaculaceae bacterium]
MKKIFSRLLFVLIGVIAFSTQVRAQVPTDPLPLDPQVRKGVLPNGLTYYIRHNETPKGQADFYIAQKVGSILENDEQRGLAHFLEHMCFNGTDNFPGNELVAWLETKGVKFGQNLNAYTSIDETVYNISNVPTASIAVQDSCLLILHDWADGLLLLPEEIDKERGVIHEEWRSRNVGQQRLMEQMAPAMYPGSKYGCRLPIGTMEVVDNFPPKALRDYYEAWYRPDQQGIVVVGDIDVDRIEAKIKEIFSPIEMPANAPERVYEPVPDTDGTIIAIGTDPEMPNSRASIYFKNDVLPRELRGTMAYWLQDYVCDMISAMLNNRLDEISSTPDSPFAGAGAFYGNYFLADTKDALTLVAIGKGEDILPSMASVYRELLRAYRGGFTISEYDRARSEYLSRLEKAYNNREKAENESYVNTYVRNFIDGTPATGIEMKYQTLNMLLPQLPVEMINQTLKELISDNNRVVTVMLPEKEGIKVPTEEAVRQMMAAVDAEDIPAFVDEVKDEPLIANLPAPGKVVATQELPQWGATEWTLSNGAKVVVKKTDFKADEILLDAQALGGTSVYPDSYANTLVFLPQGALSQYGLGTYTYKDIQKYLQGKQCQVNFQFDDYCRDISGSTTPKDLKTMMELLYSHFTQFNMSADEFQASKNMITGFLHNQETNPQYVFSRDLRKALYDNPRKAALTVEAVEAASLDEVNRIVKDLTANAADYTFFFVGNVDMDELKTLCEQYIATLPGDAATASKAPAIDGSLGLKKGEKVTSFTTQMQTPQTFVAVLEFADMPYTAKDRALSDIAGQVMTERLLKKVREDMGAVYSIWASGSMSRQSVPNTVIQSVFPMKPEMKEQVLDIIAQEFKNMESDVTAEELAKAVEFEVKEATEAKEKNNAWLNTMAATALNGVDVFNGNVELLQSLTPADVQDFMKRMNANATYRVVILDPEAAPAE